METSITKHQKNLSAIIHLSTFSKYFIPFGNFILPLVLWTSNRNDSVFVDYNGKQALNFQISILLYSIVLGTIAVIFTLFTAWDFIGFVDIIEHNKHSVDLHFDDFRHFGGNFALILVAGALGIGLLVLDIFCTIIATIRANEGVEYKYPVTIPFIK